MVYARFGWSLIWRRGVRLVPGWPAPALLGRSRRPGGTRAARRCDGLPVSSRPGGFAVRWIPGFTPVFPAGLPYPSHRTRPGGGPAARWVPGSIAGAAVDTGVIAEDFCAPARTVVVQPLPAPPVGTHTHLAQLGFAPMITCLPRIQ